MGTVSTTLPSDGQTIDASDVNTPINAILSEFNGNIDDNNIKTGANINGAKLLAASVPGSALDTTLAGGWISGGLPAYSSATNNGNKSYDIVFASTVASLLSPGMRLRTTRTVTAPTQCADLEASSSQYFSATSASLAGMTFTDDFTCMGWVKLESYTAGGIISRYNGTTGWILQVGSNGTITLQGLGTAGAQDYVTSYQSIPLGRWVHIAASMDMSGASGLIYMDGVLVPSSYTNGAVTALIQAGDLNVGAYNGSNFLDGKIAQAAVFSSVLSASTIRSYMSQGLSGSESTLVSAFSCNNSLLDLNTTNNNDLTASGGALMTNADSPFGQDSNGVTAGTTDYALVMKVSTTTATVQVPEGCTIPTSGGVSAVAYSTATSPFGFTTDKGRWLVSTLLRIDMTQTSPVNGTFYNLTSTSGTAGACVLKVPAGAFRLGYMTTGYIANTTSQPTMAFALSTANNTGTEAETIQTIASGSLTYIIAGASRETSYSVTPASATDYFLNVKPGTASATSINLRGSTDGPTLIYAIPAGV